MERVQRAESKESIMASTTQVRSTSFTKPDDKTLVAEFTLEAPRELVWAAHTQCEHVKQWLLGPEGWTMPTCEIDLRPGGRWRYVYRGPDGTSFSMSGEYRELDTPERLVNTETMEGSPGSTLNTLILTEQEGRTTINTVVEYPSQEMREAIIETGMMDGWAESYERLERYLRSRA
jgi:uncharacterized protein YndB with AHSA1/START domain